MDFLKTCESVFDEIQQMRRNVLAGKLSPESYALQLGGLSLMEKQQKLMIAAIAIEYKTKQRIPVNLKSLGDPEDETIDCPDQETKITLSACLDYSGSHESCKNCPNFKRSRRLLLP